MAIPFKEALLRLENHRVKSTRPLIPPQILQEDLPLYVVSLASPLACAKSDVQIAPRRPDCP